MPSFFQQTTKTNLTVGIEIEFFIPKIDSSRAVVLSKLREEGISCSRSYELSMTEKNGLIFGLKNDTSIKPKNDDETFDEGLELISTPFFPTNENFDVLSKVVDILIKLGAKVNNTCGFHVHIGVGNKSISQIQTVFERFYRFSKEFDNLVNQDRKTNKYCSPMTLEEQNYVRSVMAESQFRTNELNRYHAINPVAISAHRTVEFRQFHGTLDILEMVAWIKTIVLFFETSCSMQKEYQPIIRNNIEKYKNYKLEFIKNLREKNKRNAAKKANIAKIENLLSMSYETNKKLIERNNSNFLKMLENDEQKLYLAEQNPTVCQVLNTEMVAEINDYAKEIFNINELIIVVDQAKNRFMMKEFPPVSIKEIYLLTKTNKVIFSYLKNVIQEQNKEPAIVFNKFVPDEKPGDAFITGLDIEALRLLATQQIKKRTTECLKDYSQLTS